MTHETPQVYRALLFFGGFFFFFTILEVRMFRSVCVNNAIVFGMFLKICS